MKTKLSKKRAISTVLTTVIILVSSVVLGSGVVLYGTSLFQSGTQQESIIATGIKVWVHTDADEGLAWGAAKIRNTGDKVVSIDKISIRGSDIPFSQWYADTTVTSTLFQQALNHSGWDPALDIDPGAGTEHGGLIQEPTATPTCTETVRQDLVGNGLSVESICANAATGPISLNPGGSTVIYFKLTNGTLTSLDSGVNTSVNIYAGKAGAPQSVTVAGVTP